MTPKAMILAAGPGTRLRPLTDRMPKAMIPVGGRPLLEHTIELLTRHGVREIAINLHAHANVITERLGDGSRFGVHLRYSFEPQLLGTAGAVKNLAPFFSSGPFFVVYGDVFTDMDLGRMMEAHAAGGALATIALRRPDDASQCGLARQDEAGWITGFVEKPPHGDVPPDAWANAGVYVLDPALLDAIEFGEPRDFGNDVFPALASAPRALFGYRTDEPCWDIGSAERLREVDATLRATDAVSSTRRRVIDRTVRAYVRDAAEAISTLDTPAVVRAAELLLDARERGNAIYIIGNGGSATTASHMAADLARAAMESKGAALRCRALCDNMAVLSAWANDAGYESVFTLQLAPLLAPGDVVVAISASGNSPNIIAAAQLARSRSGSVLGLCGFGGGALARIADVAVVIESSDYGPVEDLQLLLNHLLATTVRAASGSRQAAAPPRTGAWEAEKEPETADRTLAAA
jgi:dTDP-glucose pyrophosphorylase